MSIKSIDGLMQERGNSIVHALELRISCIKPSMVTLHNLQSLMRVSSCIMIAVGSQQILPDSNLVMHEWRGPYDANTNMISTMAPRS